MSVPRIVHKLWMQGFDHLPEKLKGVSNEPFRAQIVQWDEQSLLRFLRAEYSSAVAQTFLSIQTIVSKSDYARLFVLHKFGGVYVDCDYSPSGEFAKCWTFLDDQVARGKLFGLAHTSARANWGVRTLMPVNNAFLWSMPGSLPVERVRSFAAGVRDWSIACFLPTWNVLCSWGPVALYRAWNTHPQLSLLSDEQVFEHWGTHSSEGTWLQVSQVYFQAQLVTLLLLLAMICVCQILSSS